MDNLCDVMNSRDLFCEDGGDFLSATRRLSMYPLGRVLCATHFLKEGLVSLDFERGRADFKLPEDSFQPLACLAKNGRVRLKSVRGCMAFCEHRCATTAHN